MKKLQFITAAIVKYPGEIIKITLEPASGIKPSFISGQFLSVVITNSTKEIRRSYSICSSPFIDEPITIAVKRIENGEVSRRLFNELRQGDVLTTLEPSGVFTYTPETESNRTIFLFAAGIGITPLFSTLKTILVAENDSHVVLIYSNRTKETILFYDELHELQNKYSGRFKLICLISESQNLLMARLNKQLIYELVEEHLVYSPESALFYTCGPINYMDTCRLTLLGMGFDKSQIKRETFFISEDEGDDDNESEVITVDTNTYTVKLKHKDKQVELDIPYNKSILDIALDNNLDLPYSCRSGICGTCTSLCTDGGVRMDYNEVLTDTEVENGKVLICVGHPIVNGNEIIV
ncbi:ferredoxin--NADP reductase [Solitalea sp. MAHUQ-68]|uniref:Ferredoxin--NADP reductase n=1 Tax=Solitalea agri TaxID=2953739 RepID=A0A9X2JC98_9SPHI|nr:ferredoxin--NADP reductase [Solitalea agri]MCO4291550.1 ferredoxin--NADP reductase [Solitalea agri]